MIILIDICAFAHFSKCIEQVWVPCAFMEALRPGGRVLLHSLAMEELNGAVGQLQTFHEDRGKHLLAKTK